jgi:para-aminobenzoate synthetase/4-amino-4-deoxychorismate lyase
MPDPARGVFETMLVVAGEPVELAAHLRRLRSSLDQLYEATLPGDAAARVADAARGLPLARLRLSADAPGVGAAPTLAVTTTAIDRAIVCPPWEHGLELRPQPVRGWRGEHKWADRRLLDALEAAAKPATALLVDELDGALLETTRANLFVVSADGDVATPPTDGRVLPGIARARAIAAARQAGAEVVERPIAAADLLAAREAFATGSVRVVEPVRSFDGAPVGGPRSPLTAAIAAELLHDWLGDRAGVATPER